MAPEDIEKITFSYNEHGDLIAEVMESSRSEYDLQESGLTAKPATSTSHGSRTLFRYKYDSYGNWTEKIIEDTNGTVSGIEHRTISYF